MTPDRKREIIDAVRQACQVTIRTACAALHFDRSTYHYQSRRTSSLPEEAHQGDLRDTCPLWLSAGVLHPAPPRLVREHEDGLSALNRIGAATAQQDA